MKGITFNLVFLGAMTKKGKKSGNDYTIAKFIDDESNDVYEFFCRDELVEKVKGLKVFKKAMIFIDISSFQGSPKIDFVGVEQK